MPPVTEYCLFGLDHWSACMQKGEWSAWIQAVFSVVAIFAAIAIAWWQRKSDRMTTKSRQHAEATVVGVTVLSLLSPLRSTLTSILEGLPSVDRDNAEDRARRYLMLMKSFAPPSEAQMLHLHAVLPDVAEQLARGSGLYQQALVALSLINDRSEAAGREWIASNLKELKSPAEGARRGFDIAGDRLFDFLSVNVAKK